MSRVADYRAKRKAELREAIRVCEVILKATKLSDEYKRAFASMQRAGERYEKTRHADDDPSFDLDFSLWGVEPEEVAMAIDDAVSTALDTLRENRELLK